jgi:hypothetical protein
LGVRAAEGWPFALDHCAISVLEFEGGPAVVAGLNDGAHLEGLAL